MADQESDREQHSASVEDYVAWPVGLKQRKQAARRLTQERALLTRELRIIEGADTLTVSAVEVSSTSSTWRSTSQVLVIYQVGRREFLRDPQACLASAMDAIMRPLLEVRTGEGEGRT